MTEQTNVEPSLDDLRSQIEAKMGGTEVQTTPQPQIPVEADKVATHVEESVETTSTEQTQEKPVEQVEKPEEPKGEGVETQPERDYYKELVDKKGIKDVNSFAKSYMEMEKQFHKERAEESRTERQVAQPAQPVNEDDVNQKIREAMEANPYATMNQIVDHIVEQKLSGLKADNKQTRLNNVVNELATSQETMLFRLPEVQEEIKKVFVDKDNEGKNWSLNVPDNLKDAYGIAVSRLVGRGALGNGILQQGKDIGHKQAVDKIGSMTEGSGRPSAIEQPFDPNTSDLSLLQSKILEKMRIESGQ